MPRRQTGHYERAITLYEELLRQDEYPNPQIDQNLALCYQQLGNSRKAVEHLDQAIREYQTLVDADPHNEEALSGLRGCQTALDTITSHDGRDADR